MALLLPVGLVVPASAQTLTGPFLPMNHWWLHPVYGTGGVSTDGVNIYIDRDGDGASESTYAIPLINSEPLEAPNLQLTPTRDILYAFGDSCGSFGEMVYFFEVPPPPGPLTLIDSECIEFGIGDQGFYDTELCAENGTGLVCGGPPGVSPNRIAYVADAGNIYENRFKIYWFDLVNGTHTTTLPGFNLQPQLTRVPVSPYGDAAFVEHGVESTSDYTIIDLVALPRLGIPLSSIVGGPLFGLGLPHATAEMVDLGGGNYVIRVTHPDIGRGSIDYPFTPGGGTPSDPDGACCLLDGSCSPETSADCDSAGGAWLGPNTDCADCPPATGACCVLFGCFPDLSESVCVNGGGDWKGAGSTCDDCPPQMKLEINKSAPASVIEGTEFTYVLEYENTGGQIAYNPGIIDALPAGTTFVSATDGGYLDAGYVRWTVDTLGIGDSGSVAFTVIADCGITEIINSSYRINSGIRAFFGPAVTTPVIPTSPDPVFVTITSTPSHDPLRRGDTIEHEITLANSVAEDRSGITFVVDWGYASDFDALLDDAGGTVVYNGTASMRWTGDLPASGDAVIRFRTRVKACATRPEERLNEGWTLEVKNTCGHLLGSAEPPPAWPIQQPTALGLHAPGAGEAQYFFERAFQVFRSGGAEDIQLTISNLVDVPQNVSITHTIPTDLTPVGDPPFVAPTDPAAQYDSPSRMISWVGTIAPFSEVLITYRADLPTDVCRVEAESYGNTGSCANDIDAYLTLLLVPEPLPSSHLLQLLPFQGVRTVVPLRSVLCLPPEIYFGMGRGPDWDIFLAGVPNVWFNPETLEFDILDDESSPISFAEQVLAVTPSPLLMDVAVDPLDGTALYVGSNQTTPDLVGAIGRYDPTTGSATQLVAHEDLYDVRRIVVGTDGIMATIGSQDGIVQIDPADPGQLHVFSDPAVPNPTCIALDANGDYIVANSGSPKALARVDRQTGAYTVLVPDLDALTPLTGLISNAAVDHLGNIYLHTESGGGMYVQLDDPPTAIPISYGSTSDLEFIVNIACPGPDRDGDNDVDVEDFAILAGCLGGPDNGLVTDCECLDLNGDEDVDLGDFAEFQNAFTG